MKVQKIQYNNAFMSEYSGQKKREFIDVLSDSVRNPRDVQDCVAVPRGIFKAYIFLMTGSGLVTATNFLPQKAKYTKSVLGVLGALFMILSAIYFAKPFAIKGLSPTVKREDIN